MPVVPTDVVFRVLMFKIGQKFENAYCGWLLEVDDVVRWDKVISMRGKAKL